MQHEPLHVIHLLYLLNPSTIGCVPKVIAGTNLYYVAMNAFFVLIEITNEVSYVIEKIWTWV